MSQLDQPERRNNILRESQYTPAIDRSFFVFNEISLYIDRNGLAKKLSRLLIRQETDYRLWRFQHKIDSSNGSDPANSLRLRIESVSIGTLHSLAHCYLESGNLANDRVSLVFSPERWKRFGLRAGDIVSIYEPW